MTTFFLSVLVIAIVIAGMAVGVMAGRGPIKGSCGGVGALGIDSKCDLCGGDPQRCDEETRDDKAARAESGQFYDADR